MKTYLCYIKSHGEAPDYEEEFTEEELKNGCPIKWVEDKDGSSSICKGKLKKTKNGFHCLACGQSFVETECPHKKLYFSEEIQEGENVKSYRCQECDEWVDEEYIPEISDEDIESVISSGAEPPFDTTIL